MLMLCCGSITFEAGIVTISKHEHKTLLTAICLMHLRRVVSDSNQLGGSFSEDFECTLLYVMFIIILPDIGC